jgi:cell division septation protein DedD
MEEKNDLMGNIANDGNNMKKYLIIAGLVFVIFVIGIVIAKFAFGTQNNNTQVILPPEPTTKTQKSDTQLFNSIPVEQSDSTNSNSESKQEKLQPIQQVEQAQQIKPEVQKSEVVAQPTQPQKFTKPEVETTNIEPKKIAKPKPKVENKPKQSKKSNIIKNYYIQVAALTRGNPSKKFLKLIKRNGFKYRIVTVKLKGKIIKRVLVGPFSRFEAKKALPKVKDKITASAFIKKLK